MQEDPQPGGDGPARPAAQLPCDEQPDCQIRQAGRRLHDRANHRVRRVGYGAERRLQRREQAPDVDHDRRERQVLVVGAPEWLGHQAVDPFDELVEIPAEAIRGQQHQPQEHGEQKPHPEDDEMRAATWWTRVAQTEPRHHPRQAGRVAQ